MPDNYQLKTDAKKTTATDQNWDEHLSEINEQYVEKKVQEHAGELKTPYVNIRIVPFNPDLPRQFEVDESEKALALPFFILGKKLRVAVVDPKAPATIDYIEKLRAKNFQIFLSLASKEGILEKIEEFRALQPKKYEEFENVDAERDLRTYEEEIKKLQALETEVKNISAKAALNEIFIGGLRTGSSDVHFQPEENSVSVRFRIDGVLQKIITFTASDGKAIVDQLKYQTRMRLNVSNVPQDGRTQFLAGGRKINVRVSTLPTEFGESVVCRLLDSGKKLPTLSELGFMGSSLKNMQESLSQRSGLILVTGPTGSGKTTTLYTMINMLNTPERKIATLENPIEYQIPNVVQSQIDVEHDYSFGAGLKALLRQDPDVLMVGEIRDAVTAETAAQAAMTGHIVFSTLHTNSAIEAIPRLINLKLKPYILTSSLSLVVAQRLVRRPCSRCAEKVSLNLREKTALNRVLSPLKKINRTIKVKVPEFIWEVHGCPTCSHTGYRGQVAIAETFRMTSALGDLIMANASVNKISEHLRASQGMISFAEDGLVKVCAGLTTLEEVTRVTGTNFNI